MLLGLGTLLVVFMGGLAIYLGQIVAHTDEPGATSRFTGGPEQLAIIMAVFGLVIAFGLASMAGGIWQIKYGKPNRILMIGIFVVAGILYVISRVI
jgi:hypothetical protein